jgi:3-hydroxyacyl-CoA dehydrogenase
MRVTKAGVVGAGAMGAAIAELLAFNGIPVVLKDVDAALVERGQGRVRSLVEELVAFHEGRAGKEIERIEALGLSLSDAQKGQVRERFRPKFDGSRGDEVIARVTGTTSYEPFREVDFVVEAVF